MWVEPQLVGRASIASCPRREITLKVVKRDLVKCSGIPVEGSGVVSTLHGLEPLDAMAKSWILYRE